MSTDGPLRVANLSYTDAGGGAFRAAARINTAQRSAGIDAELLVTRKRDTTQPHHHRVGYDPEVYARIRSASEAGLRRLAYGTQPEMRSFNVMPTFTHLGLNRTPYDVVVAHWIGNGGISVADLGRVAHPIVLRLADMWYLSGSDHYPPADVGQLWRTGLRHDKRFVSTLERALWDRKRRHLQPSLIITPSRWLARQAESSAAFANVETVVIQNPIDTSSFYPRPRAEARHRIGVEEDVFVIAFIGSAVDPIKGFDVLAEAVTSLVGDGAQLHIAGVGPAAGLRRGWVSHGQISDDDYLADFYSAADVVVVPSRQEAFGQVASEALACGTPAVVSAGTGLEDIVVDGLTGYVVPLGVHELRSAIDNLRSDEQIRSAMAAVCSEAAYRRFSPETIGRAYSEALYRVLT